MLASVHAALPLWVVSYTHTRQEYDPPVSPIFFHCNAVDEVEARKKFFIAVADFPGLSGIRITSIERME